MNQPFIAHTLRMIARLLLLLSWLGMANAGGLGVSPIRIYLSDAMPTAALTLENNGTVPSVVQMQVSRGSLQSFMKRATAQVTAANAFAAAGAERAVREGGQEQAS